MSEQEYNQHLAGADASTALTDLRVGRAEPMFITPSPDGSSPNPLQQRWDIIRRYFPAIALFVFVVVVVTAIYLTRIPRLYDSHAVIRVDPSAPDAAIGPNQAQPFADITLILTTEASEVKDPAIVIPVIQDLDLEHDPNWHYVAQPTGAEFRIQGVPEPLLKSVTNAISVVRPPSTLLLSVTFRSRSSQLSAKVANALAETLISHERKTRSDMLRSSSEYFGSQLSDLRARMEKSQIALSKYARDNDIVSPDDKFSILNQRLSTLASELDKDGEAARHLQAELQLARANNVDALLVSDRGDALRPLEDALHVQQLQFAAVASRYGPTDPSYSEEQRKLDGTQKALDSAMAHVATQIESEAAATESQLEITQQAYDDEKANLENFNTRLSQYSLLKEQADSQTKLYDDLLQRIQQADVAAGYHTDNLRIVGPAQPDPVSAYPKSLLILVFVFLGSVVMATTAILVLNNLDRTLTDPTSVLTGTGERMIASLPAEGTADRLRELWPQHAMAGHPGSPRAPRVSPYTEAIYTLHTALFLGAGVPIGSIAVTSAQPRDGKTTTAISLAAASARHGVPTVLIDCDLRRPEIHRAVGVPNRTGLSSYLHKKVALDEIIQPIEENLWIIAAGPASSRSTELLAGGVATVIEELRARFKMVIVDCPPTLGFADSMIIAPSVDTTIFVARAGVTPREFVRASCEQLRRVRANVAGVVLNAVSAQMNQYYRYYQYYSRYYPSAGNSPQETRQRHGAGM